MCFARLQNKGPITMAESKCPFNQKLPTPKSVREWWPSQLDLKILRQNAGKSDPMGA